jgi:ubiquinone/menaquinone biosynthesis C-methylase UbiE
MSAENRFQGAMSEGYRLVRRAIPDFDHVQNLVAEAVAGQSAAGPLRVLDVGCGDGVTSATILARCPNVLVTSLDSEADMIAQAQENLAPFIRAGRCQVILHDALTYLRRRAESDFDVVASALALHNLQHDQRHALHREIFRVLRPDGLFANADKIARSEEHRFETLQLTIGRLFDTLVPLGELDLLRAGVLHEIVDAAPERLMREDETVRELAGLGFRDIELRRRLSMAALLVARKPSLQPSP